MKVLNKLNLKPKKSSDWSSWNSRLKSLMSSEKVVKVALVDKYLSVGDYELDDSYLSVVEALRHASAELGVKLDVKFIPSQDVEKFGVSKLEGVDGILVPGGFGSKGVEGKIASIRYARENKVPFLGLCFGLQLAVVEFARSVLGMSDANTTEVNPNTKHPVVVILPEQVEFLKKHSYGSTMRLGEYSAVLDEHSKVFNLYKSSGRLDADMFKIKNYYSKNPSESFRVGFIPDRSFAVLERHRHRYEVNPKYVELLQEGGLFISGFHYLNENSRLVEFIELKDHPFFVASQSHPEFKSRFLDPAPLFYGFLKSAIDKSFHK